MTTKGAGRQIALALLSVAIFGWFFHLSYHYPSYFISDMDQTATLDTLGIQSGAIPDHLNHTGFGMYLIQKYAHLLAYAQKWVSVLSYGHVSSAINPAYPVAELVTFFRTLSPVMVLLTVFALWLSVCLAFSLGPLVAFLVLGVLAALPGLDYHAALIRTELYAILYWSFALLAAVLAVRSGSLRARAGLFFVAGISLGLAYLTKIQSFFYLVAFPLVVWLLSSATGAAGFQLDMRARRRLALSNVVLAATILIIGASGDIPEGYATFTKDYRINAVAILLILAVLGLAGVELQGKILKARAKPWVERLSVLHLLMSGFFASFVLHFLIFPGNPSQSFRYLRYDAKMLFFRRLYESSGGITITGLALGFWNVLHSDPFGYFVHFFLFGMVFSKARRPQRVLLIALLAVTLGAAVLGTRAIPRDMLWRQCLPSVLSLIYVGILLIQDKRPIFRARASACALGALAALAFWNVSQARVISRVLDANFSRYGWSRYGLLRQVYDANHVKFTKHVDRVYGEGTTPQRMVAMRNIDRFDSDKRRVEFVFPNQEPSLLNVGLLSEGFSIWRAKPELRVKAFPEALREATVVDNAELPVSAFGLRGEYIDAASETNDAFKSDVERGTIAVLPRRDLDIFLFSLPKQSAAGMPEVVVSDGKSVLRLTGRKIDKYFEVVPSKIDGPFFFVIVAKRDPIT